MKQLLETGGVWSAIYRFVKGSKLLVIIDILVSILVLSIIIICFAALALAEDVVWNPAAPKLVPIPDDTSGVMRLLPEEGPSDNTVTVGHDIYAYVVGGYERIEVAGYVESSRNTVRVGSADPSVRIIAIIVQGGEATVRKAPGPAEVRVEYNRTYITNVSAGGFFGAAANVRESNGTEAHASWNWMYIENTSFSTAITEHLGADVWPSGRDIKDDSTAGAAVTFAHNIVDFGSKISGSAYASHNTVHFINSFAETLYGSYIYFTWEAYDNEEQNVEASWNTLVLIDSGPQNMDQYRDPDLTEMRIVTPAFIIKHSYGRVDAHNNTVTLGGRTVVKDLYGTYFDQYYTDMTPSNEIETYLGNTLNVILPAEGGVEVTGTAAFFQEYNFLFDSSSPSGVVGLLAGEMHFGDVLQLGDVQPPSAQAAAAPAGSRDPRVGRIDLTPGGAIPVTGTVYVLISSPNPINAGDFPQTEAQGSMGPFIELAFDLLLKEHTLEAILKSGSPHPQLEDPASGENGSLALVSQGGDLIADKLFNGDDIFGTGILGGGQEWPDGDAAEDNGSGNGRSEASSGSGNGNGSAGRLQNCPRMGFAASYGRSVYDNGGNLDLRSFAAALGLSCQAEASYGVWSIGAFMEGGKGDFKTSHTFDAYPAIHGDGKAGYLGGGLAARVDFTKASFGRFHIQAAGRFGRADTEYQTRGFAPLGGERLSYDSGYPYLGAHVGAGLTFPAGASASGQAYLNYNWVRLAANDVLTNIGERMSFEKADSQILKGGLRIGGRVTGILSAFAGLSGSYEFDGETRASVYNRRIEPATLRGMTGALELGLNVRPGPNGPFSLGLSFQGFTGRRRGVEGTAAMNYTF